MRGSLRSSDVVLGLTILVSTICSSCVVICLESDGGPQPPDNVSNGGGGAGSINSFETPSALYLQQQQPAYTPDRHFRNYYELLLDTEPVWKRAPAAGFYGMRGKKVPSSSFYGMRGKKGPSGFLGMRGKKSLEPSLGNLEGQSNPDDASQRAKGQLTTSSLISSQLNGAWGGGGVSSDSFDDYSLFGASGPSSPLSPADKRAPSQGFLGVRGRRSTLSLGQPARHYN